ncbi:MAG: resolvase [Robiginitomaculum sp.]|nr:MAG: resolvase [Robiginitomaculum sp.]
MNRVAIYARYSSDLQTDKSIEDQIRTCVDRAESEGWSVTKVYSDHAISGASLLRPDIQNLLQSLQNNDFDIVLTEALDRLSRDQEDIAHIYKRVKYADCRLITLSEGEVDELHIGLKGTMNQLFLKDLARKTHRGLQGRALAGKNAGGKAYGYDVIHKMGADGEPIRGGRKINKQHVAVIIRIMEDYVKGKSPRKIAFELNEEKIPSPTNKGWSQSTINGNRKRGNGILNNELYIGKLVWNRMRFVKDPDTGKRISRLNDPEKVITVDVPDMRIVPQELWDKVKAKQSRLDLLPNFSAKQRPPKLFSFLLKCGECGGGYSKISKKHYGCSTSRNKGTCKNRLSIMESKLEERVLGALQNRLMNPKLCKIFCEEYTAHINKIRMERNSSLTNYRNEFDRNEREIEKLLNAIATGIDPLRVKDKINSLSERCKELENYLDTTEEAPVLIHPNMAHRFHVEVQNLIKSLNDPEHRDESASLIRELIEKIVLTPNEDKSALVIDLYGNLAGILQTAQKNDPRLNLKPSGTLDYTRLTEIKQAKLVAGTTNPLDLPLYEVSKGKLVAGVGFEPTTFRL